jgi:ATP-binding protein involved in chromosome partitioning
VDLLPDVRFKVAVASGKGGVGKSTLTANLALALVGLGHRVGLLDADIYGPSQQLMMGIEEKPFVDKKDNKLLTIERHGVRVATLGAVMEPDQPAVWRGPLLMKAIDQLVSGVRWGRLDFLLVDLPPGTGDVQLTLTQRVALAGAVIVTTPQEVALIDARKGLNLFRRVNVPLLGIVENMSYYRCAQCGQEEGIFKRGGGKRTARPSASPSWGRSPSIPGSRSGATPACPWWPWPPNRRPPAPTWPWRRRWRNSSGIPRGAGKKSLDNAVPGKPN